MTMIGMMRIVPTLNYATNVFLMHNFFLGWKLLQSHFPCKAERPCVPAWMAIVSKFSERSHKSLRVFVLQRKE